VPGPAIWPEQPQVTLQAWGRVAGRLRGKNGPREVGQLLAEHEPAVCPGGQEGQWHPNLCQKKHGQEEQGSDGPLYSALVRPHLKY